jgi:transposase-like protein
MEPYMSRYSLELKESLLTKAFSPNAPSVVELARQSGLPYHTVYAWIYMSKKKGIKNGASPQRPKDWSEEQKFKAIIDTKDMTEEERGAYCRKHGLYTYHLDEWNKQSMAGLNTRVPKEHKDEYKLLKAENKKLKSDLMRKEKALAEATALLILKKKAHLIWGEGEED